MLIVICHCKYVLYVMPSFNCKYLFIACLSALTLNSTYNEKKYAEILLHYRWLFIKGNVIIGEWGIFGVEIFLHYSQFFIKADFIIGGVECMSIIFKACLFNAHIFHLLKLYFTIALYLYHFKTT